MIATNEKMCLGLEDVSHMDEDEIIGYLLRNRAALLLDEKKVGKVAVEVAKIVAKERKDRKTLPDLNEVVELAKQCTECGWCNRNCPNAFKVKEAMALAKQGNFKGFIDLYKRCYGCGRCEAICPRNLPIVSMTTKVGEAYYKDLKFKMRAGRGPIKDVEIRSVGAQLYLEIFLELLL